MYTSLRVLCACDVLLIDGTFKSCPSYFAQSYTVFRHANYTYLPLVYTLLSNKDQLTYEFLCSRIIDHYHSVHLILSPRSVITDFEQAAMNAVSTRKHRQSYRHADPRRQQRHASLATVTVFVTV